MKQCEQCIFYDAEYDELLQSGDDMIVVGQEDKEKHYCRQFDGAIDNGIITNKKKCAYRLTKNDL